MEAIQNPLHLCPIGNVQLEDQDLARKILLQSQSSLWNKDKPAVAVWHEFDLNKFNGKRLFPLPIFETTILNATAKNYLSQMDGILLPTGWAKKVVQENIGDSVPCYVVRGGADLSTEEDVLKTKRAEVFTFVHVGKLEARKGTVEMMECYLNAFADSNLDTRFILHCFNPLDQYFMNKVAAAFNHLGVERIEPFHSSAVIGLKGSCVIEIPIGRISKQDINRLYRYGSVGVFTSRGEGWNLPLLECLKSGTPCIATNYSSHTEYLTEEFGYPKDLLVEVKETELANDGQYFRGDRGNWAKLDTDMIVDKMKFAYENYGKIKIDPSKFDSLNWGNTAKRIIQAIEN